jgi:hypothetical protein
LQEAPAFSDFLSSQHNIVAAKWTSDMPKVVLCEKLAGQHGSLAVWKRRPDFELTRKKVQRNDGSVVYEFDRQNSVLEFSPSVLVTHEGSPALLQGRLYSFLSEMSVETADLFKTAKQWIKRSFEPCPFKLLSGYIGPAAMRWHRDGGVILPMFNPPATQAWEDFIKSQHRPQFVP